MSPRTKIHRSLQGFDQCVGRCAASAFSSINSSSASAQIFLVFKTLDRSSWPTHLASSRKTYESLRTHYLRAIRHPDEFESSEDPLSENNEVHTTLLWLRH
jgi:hypothetical protein